MGYYTNFSIDYDNPEMGEKYAAFLCNLNSDFNHYSTKPNPTLEELINGHLMKWYNYEIDMRELSEEFPNELFVLEGHGEYYDDLWIAYFHQGMMQHEEAQITFGDFNPEKLR